MHNAYFNWSSGKDAALAYHRLQQHPEWSIKRLLTTVNQIYQRVTMHGLRIELLEQQAQALGLPLDKLYLPANPSMEEYDQLLSQQLDQYVQQGLTHSIFGDINLQDLRDYREKQLEAVGLQGIFPLWLEDTRTLVKESISLGFKSVIICLDNRKLDPSFLGRTLDDSFLADLPPEVDPCGENGEFHTFCYDGPIFSYPISFREGERVLRTYPAPKGNDGQGVG
ncbi:MAG: ATP-binding protein, partial [Bacteroidota bacterium]